AFALAKRASHGPSHTKSDIVDFFQNLLCPNTCSGIVAVMTVTSDLRAQTLHVAGSLDPDLMTGAQAAAAVEDLAVADKALSSALMFMALRAARTNAWQGQGYKTAADWLAAKAGVSVREAHRLLGTARKAEGLDR